MTAQAKDTHAALLEALLDGRLPDKNGRFGPFGGRYVPETLMPAMSRLSDGVTNTWANQAFQASSAASSTAGSAGRRR